RVATGLRPYAQPVWLDPHRDLVYELAGDGGDGVHDPVIAAGQPQHPPVRGQPAHVRRPATGDRPLRDEAAGAEIQYRDRALTPVGDVEMPGVAADVEPVCAEAGGQEFLMGQVTVVEDPDTAGLHVGDVPGVAVGRDLHVLWHRLDARQMH